MEEGLGAFRTLDNSKITGVGILMTKGEKALKLKHCEGSLDFAQMSGKFLCFYPSYSLPAHLHEFTNGVHNVENNNNVKRDIPPLNS